jgi:hypothetical protein
MTSDNDNDNDKNIPIVKQAVPRKAYHSPKLSSFGTVTQLTQSASNMMRDDGSGIMGMNMIS